MLSNVSSSDTDVMNPSCIWNTLCHISFIFLFSPVRFQLNCLMRCVPGDSSGEEISFISCRLNELIYLVSQSAVRGLETTVPPDVSSWSRYGKMEKRGLRHKTSKIWYIQFIKFEYVWQDSRDLDFYNSTSLLKALQNIRTSKQVSNKWLSCTWMFILLETSI